jgi:hypothetical protein
MTLETPREATFVAVLDGEGKVRAVRAYAEGGCLAVDASGRILLSGTQGVELVDPNGDPAADPTWLIRWEKESVWSIGGCVAEGSHHLYLSGNAGDDATIGGKPLPPPRTTRFRFVPAYEVGFVAKLTY